jgi:FAD/FMN-containing dehydrogenase
MRSVASWGGLVRPKHDWRAPADRESLRAEVAAAPRPALAHGNGRSYGDACLNAGHTLWSMRGLDRLVAFDAATGLLTCEAGITLGEIADVVLPHGWFLPVVPGTRFVTVGGAIANDVHGKNHHRAGTFGEHVRRIELLRTDGEAIACGTEQRPDWLRATVGGLGLTGVVERATLQLARVPGAWIDVESEPFGSLEDYFALAATAEGAFSHTVAWVDCGRGGAEPRGVFFRGNHAVSTEPPPRARTRSVPFRPARSLVDRNTVAAFNRLYRWRHRAPSRRTEPLETFFWPLDGLLHWNRLYGRRGFVQHQSLLPPAAQAEGVRALLRAVAASGQGSFLAVLKTFGSRPPAGMLSFPAPGTTLAVDLPERGRETAEVLGRLDAVVAAHGGRIYPAKDARMPQSLFRSGYPAWEAFERFRDPGITSDLARRLFGH